MRDKNENGLAKFWKKYGYLLIISIAVVLIFLIFVHYLGKEGWLTLTGSESSTTIVAASIALIGGLFGSIVSLLGLALKHSVDERSLSIQERNEALSREAEKRLKNEAAIQSIGLLSTSVGEETSETQRAGVILALANLDKFAIALALGNQMMNDTKKPLDTGTFCWLIEKVITKGKDEDIKLQAILSLSQHIEKLPKPDGTPYFSVTVMDLKEYIKRSLKIRQISIQILIDLLTVQPLDKWRASHVRNMTNTLFRMYKIETEKSTQNYAGIMLFHLLKVRDQEDVISFNESSIKIKDILKELSIYKDSPSNSVSFVKGENRLDIVKAWSK